MGSLVEVRPRLDTLDHRLPTTKLTWRVPKIEGEAIVVTFDMCSSSSMIDDLTLSGNIEPFTNLLGKFKHHLAGAQKSAEFRLYKFIGDGWILLYPVATDGVAILNQLRDISVFYKEAIGETVLEHLHTRPPVIGLTFGIDVGRVARATIFANAEWVGRPINVACRLQSAVKECDGSPAYRLLVTKPFYMRYLADKDHGFPANDVERTLRNVGLGEPVTCKEIQLLSA